ncbi:MAG: sugar-transfer associated ATP-grasp domain-containing protein [Candidatus Odinarchaeota archaeon]
MISKKIFFFTLFILGIVFTLMLNYNLARNNFKNSEIYHDGTKSIPYSNLLKSNSLNISYINNKSLTQKITDFLKKTQNDGKEILTSMDVAYYIGMSLVYLNNFKTISDNLLRSQILAFINKCQNLDGGYGNWKGSRSSMESTYQAIELLHSFSVLESFSLTSVNKTLQFIQNLKSESIGFFPLENWDSADITSTYRALRIKQILNWTFPSLNVEYDYNLTIFLEGNFVPPFFISGATGYSEVQYGRAELLSSLYAYQTYQILNISSLPHLDNIAAFLSSLTNLNGGVSGYVGGLPKTGYTSRAIELYLILNNTTNLNVSKYIEQNFFSNAINYLIVNKETGSGFTASERDKTAELSSTFFTLRALSILKSLNCSLPSIDFTGVFEFISEGDQPDYGFGDYPGDTTNIGHTANAILTGQLINNISWLNPNVLSYIHNSYSISEGGYGYKPNGNPVVKYTYYAVRTLRSLHDPLTNVINIKKFLIDAQNEEGGFGEGAFASLSYLTQTYWAVFALKNIGELFTSEVDKDSIVRWISYLKKPDGTYSNFPGTNATLISTYRAVQILTLLGINISKSDTLFATLPIYQLPSGGFINSIGEFTPTMESTFYGLSLALHFQLPINYTLIKKFIMSLYNLDGGFGLRPGFSSRVRSTYYAVLSLNLIEKSSEISINSQLTEDPIDFYCPIINPEFIPVLDTNKTISGMYSTSARLKDPESGINCSWVELEWISLENITDSFASIINGTPSTKNNFDWEYTLGFYDASGNLRFRIFAIDNNNITSATDWYFLKTSIVKEKIENLKILLNFLWVIFPVGLLIGTIDGFKYYKQNKKEKKEEIKMKIQNDQDKHILGNRSYNLILLFLLIGTISFITRLFMQNSLLYLVYSLFLFRFIIGIFIVLISKYILGLRTLGLFAPIILVISMLMVGPIWGLLIFLNVFIIGYIARKLISPYDLSVGFRIGILMVFTICTISLLEVLGELFYIPALSGSILVPIIITPWFIDRFVNESEQEDYVKALTRLCLTLMISIIAYLAMSFDPLVTFIVLNPETWILLLIILILIAKKTKYTILDKNRFQNLFRRGDLPMTIHTRNRDYIAKYNSKVLFPIINKFNMKEQFDKWRVPTPELLAVISDEKEISPLMERLLKEDVYANGFVIKPSQSYGGKGILVVDKRNNNENFIISNQYYDPHAIITEIQKILQGEYLTSQTTSDRDIAIIEEKISPDPEIAKISVGLPDVRVIIFRGIPVMAMSRLPTKESRGKANLKQGAIGGAVRLSDGTLFRAVWKGQVIINHPDSKNKIIGFKFKLWLQILAVACLAQKSSGLGYAGVDIVIDKSGRILVLEINKRPGLEIQNINNSSLLKRFEFIENQDLEASNFSPIKSAKIGIDLAKKYWEVSF